MKKLAIYFLTLISVVSFVFSNEEKKENQEHPIRHYVIVTANRLEESTEKVSTSFTLISEEEIKQTQALTLAEILPTIPGFIRAQAGSIGHLTSLFIRGTNSNHNLVLINGIPINDSNSSYFDFSSLMLNDIGRIEIVRGPQSTLYGSDAIGGVINLITKKGGEGTKFNFNLLSGSDSTYKGSFTLSLANKSGNLYFNASHFSTNGNFENDDYKNTTASLRGELRIMNEGKLGFFARHTKTNLGIPFSQAGVLSPKRKQEAEETLISFPFEKKFSFLKLKLNLSYFKRNYTFNDPESFWGYSHTKSSVLRIDTQSDFNYSNGIFTIGGEWRKFLVFSEDNFGISIDNKKFDMKALFIQNQTNLNNFSITGGIRFDHHTEFGLHYSPRITGALFLKDTKFKASIGSGFRAPRPYELYTFWGNKDLKPEVSRSWEIGIEQKLINSKIMIGITHFSTRIKDLIVYDYSTFKLKNLNSAKIKGQEISLFFIPHRNFNFKLNYTRLVAKDNKDEELLRRPKHSFNCNLILKPVEKLNILLNFIYIGKRRDYDDIHFVTIENSPFNKFDISLRYKIKEKIHVFSKITNALNNKYEEVYGYPSPNRGIYFGIECNF